MVSFNENKACKRVVIYPDNRRVLLLKRPWHPDNFIKHLKLKTMKKRLIMLALVSAFGLQEFAFGMQQDTTKKQKKTHDTVKRDTTKKDTLKKIKP
ncbi:hypothetical protein ABIB50_003442 [Mucilaginibacter sp. UYCu711]